MLWAATTLHDAVRLGRADLVVRDLRRLAEDCDAALVPTLLAHADALDRGDVRALVAQAERLAEAGCGLFAVDAEAQAARLAARDGDPVAACRAATRARLRLRRCTGGPPPSLRAAPRGLSDRALEVVELAMAGATSKEIGEQLFVSTRTVDNHLRSAYRSLGVSRRDELSPVLGSALVATSMRQVE
jgi:DNA-binding CsgD family transcriptional regulator